MNRYLLFFMFVGLQANIALSNPIKDFFNNALRYFKPTTAYAFGRGVNTQSNRAEEQLFRESQVACPPAEPQLISEPQVCKEIKNIGIDYNTPLAQAMVNNSHKIATVMVVDEVNEKINNYVGDISDLEHLANIAAFKNVCNEHLVKFIKKLPRINNETIEKMPDEEIWTCMNALASAKEIPAELWAPGGIAYLTRGHIGDDLFRKMAEKCRKSRKFHFKDYIKSEWGPIQGFKQEFNHVANIDKLTDNEKNNAIVLRDGCSKNIKTFFRIFPFYSSERNDKARIEGIDCVAQYAEIDAQNEYKQAVANNQIMLCEENEKTYVLSARKKVYDAFKQKTQEGLSGLFKLPVKKEMFKQTRKSLLQRLGSTLLVGFKQNKNREE